ncbi:hypothetical protein BJF85_07110 [Saccharomonospora sp. CUA-673]|uniref:WhiB family transcriptional regulator n=1 Tax=Saccharomonospora sp. CUA-673 TaxID=1904969 RepID=UPI00095B6B23|nr:WhiB family transcriptional regulator [Saccharomonospora sp. CUA-673]OLT38995.1 hypothetical protein BJF85_07110 [Saccharomonospora sp. CUA-673]
MNYGEEFLAEVVASLDDLAHVPIETLTRAIGRHGVCGWIDVAADGPVWTGDVHADRLMAAPLCSGCPVRRECLEWEFRTTEGVKLDVWGLLDRDGHEVAHQLWLWRRGSGV